MKVGQSASEIGVANEGPMSVILKMVGMAKKALFEQERQEMLLLFIHLYGKKRLNKMPNVYHLYI